MWNQSPGDELEGGQDAGEYAAPPQPPAASQTGIPNVMAEVTWTADQLQRMEGEWRRLQRAFAYHPHVTLTPLRDDPPSAYQVDYRLTTLIVNPRSSQLEYVQNATLQVILPPGFPHDAPVVRPVTPIFHPNVSYEGIYVEGLWHPNETLLGLIRKIGDILAYRSYDPDYAVNPAALDWLAANQEILPIDQQANLSPTAGGEPLARICKYGPQSLDSMKQSIIQTQTSLLSATPPEPQTVRDYSSKTRLALNLFLEKDVPEEVQALASELEDAARELVDLLPLCAFIRERKRRIIALRQNTRQLENLRDPILADIDKLIGLVEAGDPEEPMVALKLIPEAAKLQPLQMSLPKLIGDAEKRMEAINLGLASLDAPDAQPTLIPPDSLLGKRLEREITTGNTDAEAAKQEAAAALKEVGPVVQRATIEAVALDFTARWREYMDMATKAKAMERQIREWGAEGLQAYYISNEGGRYGPYQFEQSVDLGSGDLVLRCKGQKNIELRDPSTDKALGESKNGSLIVKLAPPPQDMSGYEDAAPPAAFPTQFVMTERCDDLIVLLEFLRRSTIETVQKFATYKGTAESWAGKVCRLLARPEVKKALEDELARAARRWRHTIVDLSALAPWKERLATYFLLHRCSETIPALVSTIQDRKKSHAASKQRFSEIMARCSRDAETGRMIVPPKLSKQYNEELKLQDECVATVKSSTALLKSLIAQLTTRLQNPKLLGKDTQPQLRAVPPLPEALATLPITDGTLGRMIVPLEEMLQMELGGPRPDADEVAAAAAAPAEAAVAEGEAYSEGGEGYSGGDAYGEGPEAYAGHSESGEVAESYVEEAAAEGSWEQAHASEAGEGQEIVGSGEAYAGEGAIDFAEAAEATPPAAPPQPPAAAASATPPKPPPFPGSGPPPMPMGGPPPVIASGPPPFPPAAAAPPAAVHHPANGAPHAAPTHATVADDQWFIQDEAVDPSDEAGAYEDGQHQEDLVFGFEEEPPPPQSKAPAAPPAHPPGK
jgi:ubiquitin-protein ligase